MTWPLPSSSCVRLCLACPTLTQLTPCLICFKKGKKYYFCNLKERSRLFIKHPLTSLRHIVLELYSDPLCIRNCWTTGQNPLLALDHTQGLDLPRRDNVSSQLLSLRWLCRWVQLLARGFQWAFEINTKKTLWRRKRLDFEIIGHKSVA